MPDWFYRTVARPALFTLPDRVARAFALGMMGGLGRWAAGRLCIDLLGHMRAPSSLARSVAGLYLATPVGIAWQVDPEARASRALARFGVGCVELGPVGATAVVARDGGTGLRASVTAGGVDVETWRRRLAALRGPGVVRLARLASGVQAADLADVVEAFVVEQDGPPATSRPVLRAVAWDEGEPRAFPGFTGVVLDVRQAVGGRGMLPTAMPDSLPARISAWRDALGDTALVAVSGGIATPDDALAARRAGADLLLLGAGLVFTGPGLPKRINQALLADHQPTSQTPRPLPRSAWFWGAALGGAMLIGGLMTLVLALTRVLLPYDEHYLGMTSEEMARSMPLLLSFMSHDRVTLAGSMLAVGALYLGLALGGVRRGQHQAQIAIVVSGLTGFTSFFWFLGFGYFDPLHAFVSAVMLQPLLLCLIMELGPADERDARPDLRDDGAWRRGLWAQLLLVVHSTGLVGAGVVISLVGMGSVFVAEDLGFLCMTRESLAAVNTRIIPVVAHDRASLGGMLLACGVGLLLPVLWSWRRGRAWLWWTILATGAPAYLCAIGIHWWVGYTDWHHLLPAALGAGLWLSALALSRDYLLERRT